MEYIQVEKIMGSHNNGDLITTPVTIFTDKICSIEEFATTTISIVSGEKIETPESMEDVLNKIIPNYSRKKKVQEKLSKYE